MHEHHLHRMKSALDSIYPLTDEAWKDIAPLFSLRSLEPGDFLLRSGQKATHLAFILRGVLRELFITDDGKEFNKAFVTANSITGSMMDILSGCESKASIQALSQTQLMVAVYDDCVSFSHKHLCIERFLMQFTQQLFMKKAQREYELMCMDATQRYVKLITEQPQIEQIVPQYHIASYLGITPVSLSRIRRSISRQSQGTGE